ncbi:hypothetical protein IMZ31_21680 (plasmid) [Pontibacillus sp. ALD_SL1]|uniref:hypothetical protein n=1 Tax=Pontibacillus sp. ALD_SL1 TaxID=2777185 RepID=UPI001A979F63|nr:hypothetical protein [Pontibacillus sp. ALD_SL1]QST02064.1 hypothetical protein IMZ31_21680 [Pontibacillus sp. ALD_SL1]
MNREVQNKWFVMKLIAMSKQISKEKLRNMVFMIQKEGRNQDKTTFNYSFVKWNVEAYSKELEQDLRQLDLEGIINHSGEISLTSKGSRLLASKKKMIEESGIHYFMGFYVYTYEDLSLYELVNYLYKKYEMGRFQNNQEIMEVVHHNELSNELDALLNGRGLLNKNKK